MILRRLAQHLKEQNWTAIAIEFVLLVLGVFLGIQVANWNQARADRNREVSFLTQLREEISANVATIGHQLRYQDQVIASGRRAAAFLQSDGRCEADCAALIVDFFHASQLWGTPYVRTKYEENQRLGFPTAPAARAAVDNFYIFIDGWDAVTASAPPYRERVRGHFSPAASEQLWRRCWRSLEGRFEELTRDCEGQLQALDLQAMLAAIYADAELLPGLQFWIGQNLFATTALPEALQHAEAAIAAIDSERAAAP
jgi:hypothetical protein